MTRVLITGSEGFISSHLKELLPSADCVDIKLGQDIRNSTWYDFQEPHDIIYHLAANASIPQSLKNPLESHTSNVDGTLRVLEYAKKTGARVVFSSSSSVYGEPSEIPTTEKAEPRPMMPYALQKLMCEQYMALYWGLYGVKSIALRYMNVFGERQEQANGGGDSALALGNFLRQYKNGEPFTVVGDGEQRRDFVYAGDVAMANLLAGNWLKTAKRFEVFNIGSGENYSINEVCDMIDKNHPRVNLPPRIEPHIGLADITKAKRLLGWEPRVRLKEWLTEAVKTR